MNDEDFRMKSSRKNRLYRIWTGMKSRCFWTGHHEYHRYGGRGITVCDDWLSFKVFAKWAVENGYEDTLTIDRENVNGNYCPENCKWIPLAEQARNKSNNYFITHNGVTKTASEWSRDLGMNKDAVLKRIKNYGMTKEQAVTQKKRSHDNHRRRTIVQISDDGTVVKVWPSISAASKYFGVSKEPIRACCAGIKKKSCGFQWKYENEESKDDE